MTPKHNLRQQAMRLRRRAKYSTAALLFFRHRYLLGFTAIGLASVLLELTVALLVLPADWPQAARMQLSFVAGLLFSFAGNACFNFRVPRRYFVSTFLRFAAVSYASFALNMLAVGWVRSEWGLGYAAGRLACSGVLFMLAYYVHRLLTFKHDRNLGIAVYASPAEQVRRVFLKVGRNCDHVHIDLVDETFKPSARVDLDKIRLARRLWPGVPFAVHLMTRRADRWLDGVLPEVDWVLFSLTSDTPLEPMLARCQLAGKKVGVVWHQADPLERLYAFLPHVDFVMVLGIAQPGISGQSISAEALSAIQMLHAVRRRYRYELMFDGSVNSETVTRIPARYLVAASSVLRAAQPARVISILKTGARHERHAA